MLAAHPCPLCSDRQAHLLSARDRHGEPLHTVICAGCGLGRVDPQPDPAAVSEFYRLQYREQYKGSFEPKPFHVLRAGSIARQRVDLVRRWLSPGSRVFDIGCGGGEFLYLLSKSGYQVRGHEADIRYAAYARRELGLTVTDGPWTEIQIPAGARPGLVTLFHVLEHLPHPVEAFTALRSWVDRGALALVEVPNLEFAATRSVHRFHKAHLYHFNAATLTAAARVAGWTTRESFTSPDGGNLVALFEAADPAPLPASLSGNCERLLALERQRSEAGYWFSPRTWTRTASRLGRMLAERARARGFRDRRSILESFAQS